MTIIVNSPGGGGGAGEFAKTGCSVILSSQKEILTGTSFLIPWDEVPTEAKLGYNTGCWSSSNKERFTATSTGLYLMQACVWYDAGSSTGERALHCVLEGNSKKKVGGTNRALNSTNGRVTPCTAQIFLTTSQWVALECFQDSTATRKLEADGWETGFPMARATFARIQ